MRFWSKFIHFHSRKSVSKCRLENGGHFVSASKAATDEAPYRKMENSQVKLPYRFGIWQAQTAVQFQSNRKSLNTNLTWRALSIMGYWNGPSIGLSVRVFESWYWGKTEGRLNIKMLFQYTNPQYKDKSLTTVVRLSYLYNGHLFIMRGLFYNGVRGHRLPDRLE